MKSQILTHRGTTYFLTKFKGSRDKFRIIDNLIFDARISEIAIEDYSDEDNKKKVFEVMTRAISIYGFKPTPNEMFLNDLCDAILDHIKKFKYGHLAWDEIFLALSMNTHTDLKYPSGEDYEPIISKSQTFSVQFLAQLLGRYMIFRNHLDEMIRKMFDGIEPYTLKFNNQ